MRTTKVPRQSTGQIDEHGISELTSSTVPKARDLATSTVDVVVASNRSSPYLAEALASVQGQTWKNWRLILVDDGSPDPGFFKQWASRIPGAVLIRQEAAGPSAARNAGVRAGNGEFITFLDDDDVWHPQRLALQVAAMREHADAVGGYSAGWYMDAAGVPFGTWGAEPTPSHLFLCGEVEIPRIVTLIARRNASLLAGLFDESLRYGEDDDFILRLAQLGKLSAVGTPLVGYRRHASNVTNGAGVARRRASERLLLKQIAHAHEAARHSDARLLEDNFRRWRVRAAEECAGSLAGGLKVHEWQRVKDELAWAGRTAPIYTAKAVLQRANGRMGLRSRN